MSAVTGSLCTSKEYSRILVASVVARYSRVWSVAALKTAREIVKKQERMLRVTMPKQKQVPYVKLPCLYPRWDSANFRKPDGTSSGQITFAQIGQIRPLPYRWCWTLMQGSFQTVIPTCHDGCFTSTTRWPFPPWGWPFLDALLLAQENLWLFYNTSMTVKWEILQVFFKSSVCAYCKTRAKCTWAWSDSKIPSQLKQLYHLHYLQPFRVFWPRTTIFATKITGLIANSASFWCS